MSRRGRGKRKNRGETGFEAWGGYMAAKISKLQNQFNDDVGDQKINRIFSGVAIFVNGYTNPTGDELKRIMLSNGGVYHHYYSRSHTTHIIAENLPNTKIQNMNTDFIVGPKWITDSLEAGKLLDYKKYLLYTHQSRSQPKLKFIKVDEEETNKSFDSFVSNSSTIVSHAIKYESSDIKNSCNNVISLKNATSNKTAVEDITTKKFSDIPSKKTLSTANPNFLSEFYNNSRLHHISAAGAMFKQYVRELQKKENDFSGRMFLKNWLKEQHIQQPDDEVISVTEGRKIMHIDMDCFFVSVGLIKHPELINKPVVVTHATKNSLPQRNENDFQKEVNHFKRRFQTDENEDGISEEDDINISKIRTDTPGDVSKKSSKSFTLIDEKCSMAEIASCSYEARKKGIKNGMFLGVALKLCPDLTTIPYDFEGYQFVSKTLYDTVASYTNDIEAVSCDEMYVDLGDILKECCCSPVELSLCLRQQIQEKTKCPCSVGIGPNMITARLATKKAKPNGQFILELSQVQDFMKLQSVADLPGVGWSLRQRLEAEVVFTCEDLQKISLPRLQSKFGQRTGQSLYELCRGIDDRIINKEQVRKSVSAEVNYGIRFENKEDAERFLLELSEEVSNRLTNISMIGRTITLKLKIRSKDAPVETAKFMGHGICDNVAKSVTLHTSTSDKQQIFRESLSLLKQISVLPNDVRGVGIQVSKLEPLTTLSSSSSTSIKDFFRNMKPSKDEKSRVASVDKKIPCIEVLEPGEGHIAEVADNDHSEHKQILNIENDKYFNKEDEEAEIKLHSKTNSEVCESSSKILDLEVLNSLPEELRHQVLEEYRSEGYLIPISNNENLTLNVSPQPGPSKLSSCNLTANRNSNNKNQHEKFSPEVIEISDEEDKGRNFEDLSFSQIDDSFLYALPLDIREDLQLDFRRLKNSKQPQNNNNNKIGSSDHTVTSKKKGRPRGSVNKVVNSKSSAIQNSKTTFNNWKKTGSSDYFSPKKVKSTVSDTFSTVEKIHESRIVGSLDESAKHPNLCGEYELGSIKALISQWIEACETPVDIDLNILTQFCISLINEKDLEKLDLTLKHLHRKTRSASSEWKAGFKFILDRVQTEMMEAYDAPLQFILSSSRETSS